MSLILYKYYIKNFLKYQLTGTFRDICIKHSGAALPVNSRPGKKVFDLRWSGIASSFLSLGFHSPQVN